MIQEYTFGRLKINDQVYTQDVKIRAGLIYCPWWRQKGHTVQIPDVQDLLDHKPEILILGKGNPGLMQSSRELSTNLEKLGIELIELPTQEAVSRFNDLFTKGRQICAGLHLTC